jgi:ribonucleoside-triphosphate reductase (thioredoxin)
MDTGEKEEWYQTVARCVNGILDINGVFTHQEVEQLYDAVFNLKCCFSGRALWQLGTNNVKRIGADSLQNCWHVAVREPDAFTFTFNQLMLGGGVGFNIQPEYVYELPTVKYGVRINRVDNYDCDFIVPDNRQGWVELLRRVLECFFTTGKNLSYCTQCVRQKGKLISTFGGTASGSEVLVDGIRNIVGILSARVNHKLRPIDCLDIMNIIGSVVVAGNVRRSAELAAGSPSDQDFLQSKNWKLKQIPNWRSMSNNSVICNYASELPESFWDGYLGTGEPFGLINLDLCKSHGRLVDGPDYRPDIHVTGTNPCGEITMESYEACNLAELFLPNIHSTENLFLYAGLMYKVCKTISALPFSDPRINAVVSRNRRLGIGAGGLLQSSWLENWPELSSAYNHLEALDVMYSKELGIPTSIKLTTIKPSGTISLLAGITPGIHPAYAQQYLRRIRFSADDPLVKVCRDNGYNVEPVIAFDGGRDLSTMVVEFPVQVPESTITAARLTALQQLKIQHWAQQFWSDNSVSTTCYYRAEELPGIRDYLEANFHNSIKSVSFLLHRDHGFVQAPYEEITEEQYTQLAARCRPIVSFRDTSEQMELADTLECAGGSCPVK